MSLGLSHRAFRPFPARRSAAGAVALALPLLLATCQADKLFQSPATGTLMVAPGSLADSAAVGSTALRLMTLQLMPQGAGSIGWQVRRAQLSPWLGFSATTGSAPDTASVQLDPAGLAVGVYHDTLIVTSSNADAQPLRIPVEFTIHPCRDLPVTLDTLIGAALTADDCTSPAHPGRYARRYLVAAAARDSLSLVLQTTGFAGVLAVDTVTTPPAPPAPYPPLLAETDQCAGVTGDPCLHYFELPASRDYVVEVTSAAAGQSGAFSLSLHRPRPPAVPDTLAQFRSDTVTTIATGATTPQLAVVVRAHVSDPDGVDTLTLEAEVQPVGIAFGNGVQFASDSVPLDGRAAIVLSGLLDNTAYHWQVRARDQTGRVGPWVSFGGNAETAPDFATALPQPPAAPTALQQYKGDGITVIAVGGTNPTRTTVFKATVTDPDPGDQLRLEVEVKPVGSPFVNVADDASPVTASGGTAVASVAGLADNTAYHWQARTVDAAGNASSWVSFGNNAESATDFQVSVPATLLVFSVQPQAGTAGSALTPAVEVRAQDALGNTVTGFGDSVRVSLAANPAGGTLGGATAAKAVAGVATFPNLTLDRAGAGYRLQAASASLITPQPSDTFSILPGAPAQLAFTGQPTTVAAGDSIKPPVVVTIRDAQGNTVTSSTASVTLAIGTNPGGGVLSGTTVAAAVAGVATFDDLSINMAGTGYTLTATALGLNRTSAAFDVVPQASGHLEFSVEPSDAVAGAAIAPAMVVTARDGLGNTITTFADTVSLALGVNAGGGTLQGTTKVKAQNGVATFATVFLDKAGAGYTLVASGPALAAAISAPFTIDPAAAASLAFTVGPSTVQAGSAIQPAVQVAARDAFGNAVPAFTDSVAVALAANPAGGTLGGTVKTAAVNGVASFATLTIDKAGTGYTLAATSGTLTGATSGTFAVTPGPAARLAFTVDPSTVASGAPITPAVQVTARDTLGNVATSFVGLVSVAIGANPSGGALAGTTSQSAVGGVATFADLTIDKAGTGYTLVAAGSGLAPDTSTAFNVLSGSAGRLAVAVQPAAVAQSGVALTQQPAVQIQDANGNPVAQAGVKVAATIATGSGSAVVTGDTAVSDAAGLATFTTLAISGPVGPYTLRFSAPGLFPATSGLISLSAGPAAQLAIVTQPAAVAQSGVPFTQQPELQVVDGAGNPVAQAGTKVGAAIASGGGTLSGTDTVVTDAAGMAAYTDLTLTGTVGVRTLGFSATALGGATSAAIDLQAGAAAAIALNAGDGQSATAGTAVSIAPSVTVTDASGNPVTGTAVTFAVLPGGGSVNPVTPVLTGSNGIAAATAWTLGTVAGTYQLTADAPGLAGTPVTFTATATVGAPVAIVKTGGDSLTGPVSTTLATPHEVTVQDANGNGVPDVLISWSSSNGSVSPTLDTTDAFGVSTAIRTLGAVAGTFTTTATAPTIPGSPSVTFTVFATSGGASQMFADSGDGQADTVGQTLPQPLVVRVTDATNNPVANVTVSWQVTGGGGSLSAPTSITDGNGRARVSWTLGPSTTTAQTVRATAAGSPVNFTATPLPGPASAAQSSATASPATITASTGGSIATITVTARDANGNLIPGAAVALAATGGSNTLTPASGTANGSGVFTATLSSTLAETKTLSATVDTTALAQQPTVTVQPAAAAKLFVLTQPSSAQAGVAINPAVQIAIRDQFDNRVTTATNGITLAIQTNPGGGTLTGGGPVAAVGGVATFPGLAIDKTGTGYTLLATSGALTTATTAAFDITAGNATTLALISGSGQTDTVAATLALPYVVRVTDALGNGVPNVSVAWQALTGGGSLPATTLTNATGFASATRTLGTVAGPHSSQASVTGLSGSPVAFASTATPASPNKVGFVVQPSAVTAGVAIAPAVQVAVQDQFGNTETTATDSVFMAIGTNPAGGTLSGTVRRVASAGLVAFNDLSLDKAGAGYTLAATAVGLNGATSAAFTVSPTAVSATHSTVAASPGTITASSGTSVSTITVTARDQFDNPVPNAAVIVAATGTGNTLVQNSGTTDAAGVVTATLSSTAAAVKAVSATINGTAVTQTAAVTVLAAPATQFAFRTQPSNVVAGASITPAIEVSARDQFGNRDSSFVGTVTLAIGTNPGGGTLTGTTGVAAVQGLATFGSVQVTKAGAGYTLTGGDGAGGLTDATSTPFNVAPGSATALAFTVQPAGAAAGVAITPAVQVAAQDALGNTDTAFTGSITVALGANPGGATLSGTLTAAAVAGVATFADLSLDKVATGYTLTAASGVLTTATSAAFAITAAPAADLIFTVQPSTVAAGAFIAPAIQVTARDAFGNVATGFASSVSLALVANPTSTTLHGVTTRSAVAGVATFDSVYLTAAGTGYTVSALASGLNGDTSAAFTVTPGAAARLAFTVQPSTVQAGQVITPAVQVAVRDTLGNTVPTYVGSVTLAFGTNPGGATLGGTTTQPVASGVAVFTDLTVSQTGTGYTLAATSGTLTAATSTAFTVTPGNATQLAFAVQPSSITAGAIITPAVQVAARDALGNTDTTFSGTITIAIASNPGGSTLSGTSAVAAVAGVATFSNLSLNKSGSGYTLQATSGALTPATSTAFTVSPGAATQLIFDVQPSTTAVNGVITPAIRVRKADAFGNIVVNPRRTIQLSIASGTSGAVLSGTTSQQTGNAGTADSGVAVFGDLSINLVGANYVLRAHATAGSAADTLSSVFAITAGPATQLAFTTQPSNVVAGAAISPAVVVTARDQFGNTATGFTGAVTAAIGTNPPGTGVLSGTPTVNAVAGIATFSDLHIDKVGTGYTLTASAGALTAPPSTAFNVTASGATQLAFTAQPSNVVAGVAIAPSVQVTARDSLGNVATGFAGNVTVAIANNVGGGTLGGTLTVAAVNGVATFTNLFLDKSGAGYTLGATAGTLTAPASAAFTVTPSTVSATHSTVTASAATLTASTGASASTITATARDSFDNVVAGAAVSLAATGTANAFAPAASGTANGSGVFTAAFSSTKAEAKTVSATINTVGVTQTAAITVGPDVAASIAVQAGDAQTDTAGFPVAIPPAVVVRDQFANPVPGVDVTFAVATGNGGVVPTTPVPTDALGITAATSWTLGQTAGSNTLTATATGSGITGNPVTFTATGVAGTVSAAQTTVAASPGVITASSGASASTVTVTARDQFNNPVAGASVSLAASGTGNTFAPGNTGTTNGSGVFTAALSSTVAQSQTVSATVNTVAITQTAAVFVKSAAASQLTFGQQPTTATAGVAISPAVTVIARDPFANIDSAYATNIDIAIANNAGGGTLTGTASVLPVNGVSTFGSLSIDKAGTGYTLAATSGSLTPDTSAAFNITASSTVSASQSTVSAGTATITACSTGCVAGTTASTITVTARDQFGNPIAGAAVTLGATGSNNTFTPAATGTTNGSGVFTATLSSTTAQSVTVDATINAVAITQTAVVLVHAAAATQLTFGQQPTTATAGVAISPAVTVIARDPFANIDSAYATNIDVAIANNAGGGTLTGTASVLPANGVATFSTLSIDKAGTGYTLAATSGALTGVTSAAFDITASSTVSASQSTVSAGTATITACSTGCVAGTTASTITLTARDQFGNPIAGAAVTLGATGSNNTFTPAATGTTNGSGVFTATLSSTKAEAKSVSAVAGGVSVTQTAAVTVNATAAATLSYVAGDGVTDTVDAALPAYVVALADSFGNPVAGATVNWTVTAGGGTINGSATTATSPTDAAGQATATRVLGTTPGTATASAAVTGVVGAVTFTATVNPGQINSLTFSQQPPASQAANTPFSVAVTALDRHLNVATGFTGSVDMAKASGAGTLTGTTPQTAVLGVATFPDLSLDVADTYTLQASTTTAAGTIVVVSNAFTIF